MPLPLIPIAAAGLGLGLGTVFGLNSKKPESFSELTPQPTPQPTPSPTPQPTPTPTDFPSVVSYAAQKAKEAGLPPAPIVSQMAVESGRGTSRFAKERNNYFGLGSYDNDTGKTFQFKYPQESVDFYIKTIQNDPRYAAARTKTDPLEYIQAIYDAGYASDPNYVRTVTNTPEYRQYAQ